MKPTRFCMIVMALAAVASPRLRAEEDKPPATPLRPALEYTGDFKSLDNWTPLKDTEWQPKGNAMVVTKPGKDCSILFSNCRSGFKDFTVETTVRFSGLSGNGAGLKLGRWAGQGVYGLHVRLNISNQKLEMLTAYAERADGFDLLRVAKAVPCSILVYKPYHLKVESSLTNAQLSVWVNDKLLCRLKGKQFWTVWGCGMVCYGSKVRFLDYKVVGLAPESATVAIGDALSHRNLWVEAVSKRIGQPIVDACIAGDRAAKMLKRLDSDVIALKPKRCIVFVSAQDLWRSEKRKKNAERALKKLMKTVDEICSKLHAKGIEVILCNALPRVRLKKGKDEEVAYWAVPVYNKLLAKYAKSEKIKLVDWHRAIADRKDPTRPQKQYTHYRWGINARGAKKMAEAVPVEWFGK